MGRKQDDFMNGMEAGARPFEKKFEQLSENTRKIGEAVNTKLDGIGEVIDILADDLSDMQKKELYHLNTPYDLKEDLDDDEKEIVAALLLMLSEFTENNEYQKKFIRAVNAYIGVKAPQVGFDIACIDNIENIKTQKIIMQTIMEYFYLATEDFSFLDKTEEVFEHFSVNKKGMQEIKSYIETIYLATGKEGIAEKYGFIPKEDIIQEKKEYEFPCYDGSDIGEACADKINIHSPYIVLKEHLVYYDNGQIFCIHKQTGNETKIDIDIENKDTISANNICGYDKYIYIIHSNGVYIVNVETDISMRKIKDVDSSENIIFAECNEKYLIYSAHRINTMGPRKKTFQVYKPSIKHCIDLQTMEEIEINLKDITGSYKLVQNIIYFISESEGSRYLLYKYNIESKEQKIIAELDYEAANAFLQEYDELTQRQLTCQYGKYLISAADSYSAREKGVYYYCLDMEKDIFESINILSMNPYEREINYVVAYNYIYIFSVSSNIERYNILTRKKEKLIHSNNIVYSRKEGIFRKNVSSLCIYSVNIIGNWIYYSNNIGGILGEQFRISIKEKEEKKISSFNTKSTVIELHAARLYNKP